MDLGIVVEVAGRKMQKDFEPVLERQIHYFVNGASRHPAHRPARHRLDPHQQGGGRQGLQPGALRQDPARPLPRRLRRHRGQGAGDDLSPIRHCTPNGWSKARAGLRLPQQAPGRPDRRAGGRVLLLHAVPVVRAEPRLRGQPGAPGPVRRLQLAGLQGLLQINPTGPNQPIKLGKLLDAEQGLLGQAPTTTPRSARTAWCRKSRCTRSWRTR